MQLAFFGGVYNNHLALQAAIADARQRGAERLFCLGDLGAFGPHPNRTCELIREQGIEVIQGNYDHSVGHGLDDCRCGYTDPRDNEFAQISYDYTFGNTSDEHRAWLRTLLPQVRLKIDGVRLLLCHGSPRRTNEFLWESTTSTQFLAKLCDDFESDVILGTHTGLHWQRSGSKGSGVFFKPPPGYSDSSPDDVGLKKTPDPFAFINVGVLGRPENDGTTNVWYTLLKFVVPPSGGTHAGYNQGDRLKAELRTGVGRPPLLRECSPLSPRTDSQATDGEGHNGSRREPATLEVEFVPLAYDHEQLAREMRDERLPDEFIKTILTGWWTTCLEVLPSKERRRGQW
jgi:predicted phosphodiesterase